MDLNVLFKRTQNGFVAVRNIGARLLLTQIQRGAEARIEHGTVALANSKAIANATTIAPLAPIGVHRTSAHIAILHYVHFGQVGRAKPVLVGHLFRRGHVGRLVVRLLNAFASL